MRRKVIFPIFLELILGGNRRKFIALIGCLTLHTLNGFTMFSQ